jgi:molybdopterin synthase sulfur carrier subunit
MPKIRLKYLAPICDIVGTYQETLDAPEGTTLMDVVAILCERYGESVHELFFDDSGVFRPMFIIICDGEAMDLEDMGSPLDDGVRCAFVPPIAGG